MFNLQRSYTSVGEPQTSKAAKIKHTILLFDSYLILKQIGRSANASLVFEDRITPIVALVHKRLDSIQ